MADDHTLVRAGIRVLLERMPGKAVVAEASQGREVLELLAHCPAEVVLMDISMPELNGLEATARILKEFPHVKVIVLSMFSNEQYVFRALQLGVSGYLLKDSATAELELALDTVAQGRTYLSPAIARKVGAEYVGRAAIGQGPLDHLSARHREVLQLIAEGKNTKEIGLILGVSAKTVETHRSALMSRLGIHDVPGLVRYAIRTGVIDAER